MGAARADASSERLEIDVAKADAPAQWSQGSARLVKCEAVAVTLWYAFGSMRLTASRLDGACHLEIRREIEQDVSVSSCRLPLGQPWQWDPLTANGHRLQAPPALPALLASACQPLPPKPQRP